MAEPQDDGMEFSGAADQMKPIIENDTPHAWKTALRRFIDNRQETTTRQALMHLGIQPGQQTRRHQMRVGRILRQLGFDRVEQRRVPGCNGQRQRWYVRTLTFHSVRFEVDRPESTPSGGSR